MKAAELLHQLTLRLAGLALLAVLWVPFSATAALEQSFPMLQIGTITYSNVTITTKSKNYVFLIHSQGMTNIKVADLPADVRVKLGYEDPAASAPKTNTSAVWAQQTLAKLKVPEAGQMREDLAGILRTGHPPAKWAIPPLSRRFVLIGADVALALYLLHCYCCMLICRKAGDEPGPLIWLPILQVFPMLRAAGMSGWWFFAFLVPLINLLAQVLWCIKITQARGKSLGVAFLLIFPLSSPFAFLYLAFSSGESSGKPERRVEIMTLEAA